MTMRVRWQVRTALWLEFDANDAKHAIEQMTVFAEIFGESQCGACKSQNVRPVHRKAKGYDFYEIRCLDCGASLKFGQKKEDGSLFPKRKGENDEYLPHNGWVKYQKAEASSPPGES
jgi:hypothetical protein